MTNNKNKRKSHKTPSPLGSITKGVDILLEGETGKAQRLPLGRIVSFVLPHLNFFGRKNKRPHATRGPKVLRLKPNFNLVLLITGDTSRHSHTGPVLTTSPLMICKDLTGHPFWVSYPSGPPSTTV